MTTKVENNDKNRMALAEQVMDSMDMKTMIQCMYEHLLPHSPLTHYMT